MYSAAAASWPPVSGTASRIVIQERGGVWGLSLTKMHGMRWKVNSNLKTKERRNMKGDGCLDCNKNTEMTCRFHHCIVSAAPLSFFMASPVNGRSPWLLEWNGTN
ncbi:hypothetical protein CHARACLAT_017997 [Characodon lateralis]|uniref:Uncharacterized protein n=1 Tax=Characodon lateralis TaxID=208331 RepID=A0ABU7ELR0_9TELE|nr:hypothetical protein [Characodon lateralis]